MRGMNEATMDRSWLTEAKQDIDQWSVSMPKDADSRPIDWRWVASLDLEHGIGAAARGHVDAIAVLRTVLLRAAHGAADAAENVRTDERPAGADAVAHAGAGARSDIAVAARSGTAVCSGAKEEPLKQTALTAEAVHDLLKEDLAIRDRLEPVIAQCNSTFMTDFDRLIASYRLPRALAYANRRLCDEIALLRGIGVHMGLWTVAEERRERVTVPVLHPAAHLGTVNLDDIQDRTAEIVNGRAERRAEERRQKRASDYSMSRANLSGVTSPGGSALLDDGAAPQHARSETARRLAEYRRSDWRDVYLPGRDVDTVMGIDIETTGIDPARVYIIDAGFEYMNMISPRPADAAVGYRYEQDSYDAGDAYGQARLAFGVTPENAVLGNDVILGLTGIDVCERASCRADSVAEVRALMREFSATAAGGDSPCAQSNGASDGNMSAHDGAVYRMFDEWPEAQMGLLQRLQQQPYVAHNARFEHGFFMLNVAGYAESYRAGNITIIDTLPMSRRWDEGSIPDDEHPYGNNTLDAYAKRQGALDASMAERHLGLEDTHIMLVAMKHHLRTLRAEGRGPWGADGKSGVGGKHCGRRW